MTRRRWPPAFGGMKGLAVTEAQFRANKVPTLCLIGDQDPLKEGVDAMQKVMANLTVEVITGTDHMTCFRSPRFHRRFAGISGQPFESESGSRRRRTVRGGMGIGLSALPPPASWLANLFLKNVQANTIAATAASTR